MLIYFYRNFFQFHLSNPLIKSHSSKLSRASLEWKEADVSSTNPTHVVEYTGACMIIHLHSTRVHYELVISINQIKQTISTHLKLTKISGGGLVIVGRTQTHSAGKSPRRLVREHSPYDQPEFMTASPFSCSKIIRSPFLKLRNEEPSPES